MTTTFKPSEVVLRPVIPLMATMGRAERELAAAMIVRTCAVKGDAWQPVGPATIGEVIRADLDAKLEPWTGLNSNPFCPSPDFRDLVKHGFARWTAGDDKGPLELTAKGIEALRRWVRR